MGESKHGAAGQAIERRSLDRRKGIWHEAQTVTLYGVTGNVSYGEVMLPRMPALPDVIQCGGAFFTLDAADKKWKRARCFYASIERGVIDTCL
jgi:hypothetical protein